MPLTTQGKDAAIAGFCERQQRGKTETKINNGALYAGSPMHFNCIACGCQDITVPESWITKPDLCMECAALKTVGWLDAAMDKPVGDTTDLVKQLRDLAHVHEGWRSLANEAADTIERMSRAAAKLKE